jgi:hypothetical protein
MKSWTLKEIERAAILSAWQRCGYDAFAAARLLGIGKTTFYRKLKEYGVQRQTLRITIRKVLCDEAARQLDEVRSSLLEAWA